MKKRKKSSLQKYHNINGYLFLSPWLLGFLLFTAFPFVYTFYLSFNQVTKDLLGWQLSWVGFTNYKTALMENINFNPLLIDFITREITYVPTIIVISFILSLLLNQKIKFRAGFRTIYFFPVIVLSGSVMDKLQGAGSTRLLEINDMFIFKMIESYSPFFSDLLMGLFNNFTILLWFTGIPIILFINGLQKIPSQLYEAAQIDGANSWQILWKITIPNMKSTALVSTIYTIIQLGAYSINPLYYFIQDQITKNYSSGLGFAATTSLIYSLAVFILVGIAFLVFRDRYKVVVKEDLLEKQRKKLAQIQKNNNKKELKLSDVFNSLKNMAKGGKK